MQPQVRDSHIILALRLLECVTTKHLAEMDQFQILLDTWWQMAPSAVTLNLECVKSKCLELKLDLLWTYVHQDGEIWPPKTVFYT